MNFEKNQPSEKKLSTPRYLLDVCQRFADALANGDWFDSENREVAISRSYLEVIGQSIKVTVGEEKVRIPETRMRTEVAFLAEKDIVDKYDDGGVLMEEHYTINARFSEVIDIARVPAHVLEKAPNINIVSDTDDNDPDEDDDDAEPVPLMQLSPALLDAMIFELEHQIAYEIDENGDICDHCFIVRYKLNGNEISQAYYSRNSGNTFGTDIVNREVVEQRLANQPQLDESDIIEFLNTFEKIIENVLEEGQLEELQEEMITDEDDHYRRALGIIAITAAGFKHIKL